MVLIIGLNLVLVSGCQTKAQTGALVGGAAGAAVGDTKGALISGALGAGGGYLVGRGMDKKDQSREAVSGQQAPDTVTIRVPNEDGTVTPVTLKRSGDVWVGPKGETYKTIPTSEELRPTYGK
jgi:uncharacterized protein YcfJ